MNSAEETRRFTEAMAEINQELGRSVGGSRSATCSAEVFLDEFKDWVASRNYFWCAWRCLTHWREWRRSMTLSRASLIMGWRPEAMVLEVEACKILAGLFSYPHRMPKQND